MDIIGFYPTFYMPWIGSAWVMGIIGVIHVVASHTSVGASFLFALLETKAFYENKPELMEYIRRYGRFLLVFSYIIGSVTGVGICYAREFFVTQTPELVAMADAVIDLEQLKQRDALRALKAC